MGAVPFQLAMGAAQYSAQGKIGKYNQAINAVSYTHLTLPMKRIV